MAGEDPFRVLVRRDTAYDTHITVRFTVADGMGQLSMKKAGRVDPGLSVHYEENGIDPELLRAARFVYNLNQQRQSFALSRLTPEICARLHTDQWSELKALIEFGFRYLVIAEESLAAPASPMQVQVAASVIPASGAPSDPAGRVPASRAPAPAAVRVGEPVPSRAPETASPRSPEAEVQVRRPVPMEPALAAAALDGLSRDAAIAHLRAQLGAVDAMHHKLELLERKLASARSREKDLLAVLARWQDSDAEPQ